MGATQNEGMPLDLFSSGEPRWLGAQFNRRGEVEQPRVLLVSVPYALKASDAETLGGRPASAYLLAGPVSGSNTAGVTGVGDATGITGITASTASAKAAVKPKATPGNTGQPNYVGKFTNTTDLVDSGIYEVNGNVGINTTKPLISLDARTGPFPQMGMAQTVDYLTFFASDTFGPAIYWDTTKDMRFGKGGTGLYNPFGFVEQMRIQSSTGNVGIGTLTPASKLDVAGDINFTGSVRFQGSPFLQVPPGGGNIALGVQALQSNTTGSNNSAVGYQALAGNTGSGNTAVGSGAMVGTGTGSNNSAVGYGALDSNTTGSFNTAIGQAALGFNTAGSANTAVGASALFFNGTGIYNTASGYQALQLNTSGSNNTAIGTDALQNNTASGNTAVGSAALITNGSGTSNTAMGQNALFNNTTGFQNTAIGWNTLPNNTGGNNNIAIGFEAGINLTPTFGSNILIGSPGAPGEAGRIRIGNPAFQGFFFAAGISGVATGINDAVPVLIDSNGQMGTASSSRRFKEDIQDMGTASHDLMRLRPVTFRYKKAFTDGAKPIQYGLIAEEVNEVYPDLVAHSADGQIETVKYQLLGSMLLNEVQRQQAEIGGQKSQIQRLEERLAKLEAALAAASVH